MAKHRRNGGGNNGSYQQRGGNGVDNGGVMAKMAAAAMKIWRWHGVIAKIMKRKSAKSAKISAARKMAKIICGSENGGGM
jgi:hypothetical protein